MRHGRLTGLLGGLSAVFAGCGPECVPEEGLGPDVSWGPVDAYARTGEPVTLDLHVSARNIVDGYLVHGHCEGEGNDLSGTVTIAPAGGPPIAGALVDGAFAAQLPYTTALDLQVDTTAPTPGTYTEHWLLPSVFTLAATPAGTDVQLTWTPPVGDHGELAIDLTDVQTNSTVSSMTVPDTGSLTVPATTFTHPGEYYLTGARAHPAAPHNTLRIGATYIQP